MPRSIARWSCGIFLLYRCAERWFTSRNENALCVLGCFKDGGADREEDCRTRNLRLTLPAEFILLVEHAPSAPGPSEAPAHDAGQFSQPLVLGVHPAIFDRNVLALDVARPSQRLTEGGHYGCASVAREGVQPADHRDRTLLCPRADRQTSCPTQERPGERYTTMNIELPPPRSTP